MATLISPFMARHSADLTTDSAVYFNFTNQGIGTLGTTAQMQNALPCDVTGGRIAVALETAPGAGNSRTFEIWNQTLDESISVTISDTATEGNSGDDTVSWSAGDLIVGRATGSGTADTTSNWWPYAELHATDRVIAFAGSSTFSGLTNTAPTYYPLYGVLVDTGIGQRDRSIFQIDATLKEVAAVVDNAPGTSNNVTATLLKDDSSTGITVVINDSETQDLTTSLSLDMAPGDTYTWQAQESTATSATLINFSAAYQPDTSGYCMYTCGTADTHDAAATEYLAGVGNSWSATLANRQLYIGRDITLIGLRVNEESAAGAGATLSHSIDIDGTPGSLTVDIAGASEVEDVTTGTVAVSSGQFISVQVVPDTTPAASRCCYGIAIDTGTITTSVSVEVPVASLVLTPYAPTVTATANVSATPGVASLVLTPYAPGLVETIDIPVASLTLTPYAPSVAVGTVATPGVASLVLTPYAPEVLGILRPNVQLSASVGSHSAQTTSTDAHV